MTVTIPTVTRPSASASPPPPPLSSLSRVSRAFHQFRNRRRRYGVLAEDFPAYVASAGFYSFGRITRDARRSTWGRSTTSKRETHELTRTRTSARTAKASAVEITPNAPNAPNAPIGQLLLAAPRHCRQCGGKRADGRESRATAWHRTEPPTSVTYRRMVSTRIRGFVKLLLAVCTYPHTVQNGFAVMLQTGLREKY